MEHVATLFVNDELLKDPTNLAKAFNNLSVTITVKLNIQQTEKGDDNSKLKIHFLENSPA